MKFFLSTLLLVAACSLLAQAQYTRYDDVPGNVKSYKPAYQADYPDWAKMLYAEPINYNSIQEAFAIWEQAEKKKGGQDGEKIGENKLRPIRKYYKNWSRHIQPWVGENGVIELPNLTKYNEQLRQTQKSSLTLKEEKMDTEWTFLGPKETFWLNESGAATTPLAAPWQVNVYSFDVAATNPNILYCGTETGYVNKTVDKGEHWALTGQGYNFGGGITAVVVDPTNAQIVYAAGGNQIHKTTDGAASWAPMLSTGNHFQADRLEIDADLSSKIYAAANDGIYISTDAGNNWSKKYNQPTYDIHRHPSNANIVYALCKVGGQFELQVSTDGGDNFTEDLNFPQNITDNAGGLLAVSADNPEALFAILLSSNNTPYLYKGDMSNGNWSLLAEGGTSALAMDNGQGYYDLVLGVSQENENIIYVGASTLYKSSNGNQFSIVGGYGGNFPIHPDMQDIKVLTGGELWVTTDGGMNYSSDQFTSVNNHVAKINGIIGSDFWGFDQGWNEDLIVSGRYHNGNTSMADFYGDKALRMGGAESPTGWVLQGKSRHVAFDDLGAGWILPSTAEGMPEGRFTFSKHPNMDEYGGRRSNLVFHPNYSGVIFVGEGNSIWKSEDSGESYTLIHDFGGRVRYMQIAYANPDVLYADIENVGLLKSEDGGFSWTAKPSLTSAPNGNSSWRGKLFFAISPVDENQIYACLQNGTWSSDIGKIFSSSDGGDSWEDWTGDLSVYTKNLVVQSDAEGKDIVYLFTNARDKKSEVFIRDEQMSNWEVFGDGFPAGFHVNLALPFFRDSKLRVSGNGGVWESPMHEEAYQPIINPWVEKPLYNCMLDTVYFDDHSMINHEGCSWQWEITPTPAFISDATVRNPKVVLGEAGSYDVKMTLTKNGTVYSKEITNMVSATSCPSLTDCSNPAALPKDLWSLVSVDSEEPLDPGLAVMAFDNDPSTIWHTLWTSGNDVYPHEIVIDMGADYLANDFTYLPRQQGVNGRVKDYELYISDDANVWGDPIKTGQFDNSFAPSKIIFDTPVAGRYFKLKCLSEINGNIWASAAELSLTGCYNIDVATQEVFSAVALKAFPIPTTGMVTLDLPVGEEYSYAVFSSAGQMVMRGSVAGRAGNYDLDLGELGEGVYFIKMIGGSGVVFVVKVGVVR